MKHYPDRIPQIKPRDLLVVACTPHFFGRDYVQSFTLPDKWGLNVHCEFTDDLSRIDEADALWFHGPSIRRLPNKKPDQKWIVMSMESDRNYPFLRNEEAMGLFDISMTYRLDSDVPCVYPNTLTYGTLLEPPRPIAEKKNHAAPGIYIASNPVPERDAYVAELMQHIAIDSPGRCLNNISINGFDNRPGSWTRNGFDDVMQTIARYKFYITFENSVSEDYVTERVLMAWACGTVPVYRGAPNIREFAPGPHCLINADDHASAAELAMYLKELDNDDNAYLNYLDWKTSGLSAGMQSLLKIGDIEPKHRMAIKLLHGCDSSCDCGGRLRH